MKAEKEINRLWTEFNIGLWCAYALYFTKKLIYAYSYQPTHRVLNKVNKTGGRKLNLTQYFSQTILSQGEDSEKRKVKPCWTVSPNLWISGSLFQRNRDVPGLRSLHATGMFQVF